MKRITKNIVKGESNRRKFIFAELPNRILHSANIVPMAAVAITLFAGCSTEDPIYDALPSATITITTDWSDIGTENTVPSGYTVRVGNYSAAFTDVTNKIDNLFSPGDYTAYVYNTAESITVTGTMAAVAGAAIPAGFAGSFVNSMPGWMYDCRLDETIGKHTDHSFIALMAQQVRELTFVLTLTGDATEVSTVTGVLTGVAGSYDMSDGTHGTPSNVAMTFEKQTTGVHAGKYVATVRLLGIVGSDQTITVSTTYADYILGTQVLGPENVSGDLTAFNTDKRTPMELDLEMETLARGTIMLTADWSNIGTGLAVPSGYTVRMGDYSLSLTGETNRIDNLFSPGDYTAYVYNMAECITVTGTVAAVVGAATPVGASGSFINGTPGWMYACRLDETIGKNTDHSFTAVMSQQVRELTFVLTPEGDAPGVDFATATGVLTGVAGSYNMSDGTHGTPSSVAMTFSKQTTGTHAGKYTATVRLLGVVGSDQVVTVSLTYPDEAHAPQVVGPKNVSSELAVFNTNKRIPMVLDLEVEMPTVSNGVLINGIYWAECNVDVFGTFAATPESYGMIYQFDRKVSWLAEGSSAVSSPTGQAWRSDNTGSANDVWEADNDPCPDGWRVPTYDEYAKLRDNTKVDYEWIATGVKGSKFTDKTSGDFIFLPAVGYRHPSNGSLASPGGLGLYGTGTTSPDVGYNNGSYFLICQSSGVNFNFNDRANGVSIRCVRAE